MGPKADGYTKTYRDGVEDKGGEENEHFCKNAYLSL